ncbi:class I poly(R)-hydroxyalkanoic acid synthase [Candidatus Parabeggiatoa sp. HSG14]|uniref:PHA/PHB synthase family protein n=1 Tax=Candidatus Parabeggiatoa sp. HSG14 TaxID=3055593 RepID=UPI0025A7D571|nr:class I poly(R)-hydroxyalkanoic acid synthase [Thiotrichales bacterium HSG14]
MQNQEKYTNPQELFQSFSKDTEKFLKSFTSQQWQEMLRGFMQSWNSLMTQSLQNPQNWVEIMARYQQQQMNLWLKMLGAKQGESLEQVVTPQKGDRRFAAPQWNENPIFDYIKQSYLLASNTLTDMAKGANLDEDNQKKLDFYTKYFVDALSPTNFVATNPEVMQLAIDTKGQSLVDGLQNLLGDLEKGRISQTDESAFELGKNLAVTPGTVVYENELMQLIQYKPSTESVSDRPLLIVPPCINKFYILDLRPENSFVKYTVDQGNTVFLISWRNPDKEQGNVDWNDYLDLGVLKAIDIAKEITEAEKINAASWCIGGTLLATALAVLHHKQDNSVASATYFTTMLDFSEQGDLGIFINEKQLTQLDSQLEQAGILSGKSLVWTFSTIRANDLIWSYVVNNYLKGQAPKPFDILHWNNDPTNLPGKMYHYYIHNMYVENNLVKPNALTLCGVPIDLSNIKTPSYFISAIDDHIAPWKTTFTGTQLMGGDVEFVLGASGHIAGVINHPTKKRRNYWINGQQDNGPAHWLETAESQPGSWWPHWIEWLKKQGGEEIEAPTTLGNTNYPPIEDAPGRYVTKRIW